MLKEVQALVTQNPRTPQADHEWRPDHLVLLNRVALGLTVGLFDVEKNLAANELRHEQRTALVKPLARCCRYLLEVFPLLGIDVAAYPESEKLGHEMASRPMQMFLLRRDVAQYAAFVASLAYGDETERAALWRKHPTLRLDLAYTALGIWGQLRRLAVRHRVNMDDVLGTIKGETHVSTAEAT